MTKLLFPTDFSDQSEQAFHFAIKLFDDVVKRGELSCIFLHAYPLVTNTQPQAGAYISTAVMAVNEGLEVKHKELTALVARWTKQYPKLQCSEILSKGASVPTIRQIAEEEKVDMIVMGASGISGLERVVLGSNAGALAEKAPCPVLIVPSHASVKMPERILFATDFKNLSNVHILDPLRSMAEKFNSDLMLLHIYKEDRKEEDTGIEMVEGLSDYFGLSKFDYFFLEDDDTIKGIEDFVSGYSADMLTLVAQERNFFQRLFHKSVTKELLVHSKIPLLILHPVFWGSDEDDEVTFKEKVQRQVDLWHTEIDRLRVQSHLGRVEAEEQIDRNKEKAKALLSDVNDRLGEAGDIARDKWHYFQKEMSDTLTQVKKSLAKSDKE